MAIKSVSGLVFYVKDVNKTATFYEALGFRIRNQGTKRVTIYLNWFWIDFLQIDKEEKSEFQAEANAPIKGKGVSFYISVDDVDVYYKELKDNGLKPSTEPKSWPWGNREFVLKDPDGFKLVFFKRV